MSWQERISVFPLVCLGQVCIRGTRVPVSVVLDNHDYLKHWAEQIGGAALLEVVLEG